MINLGNMVTLSVRFVFGRGETVAMVDVGNVNNQEESSHHSVAHIRADTTTQVSTLMKQTMSSLYASF